MKKFMQYILHFLLVFGLWLALTWSLDKIVIITGAIVSGISLVFFGELLPINALKFFNPRRWYYFIIYCFVFIWECIKANLDVAYRVLHPMMPINPGIVAVRTELKTDIAKTVLANSITLTPGTLTVNIKGKRLFIHWINVKTDDIKKDTDIIVKKFEKYLKRIFE